MRDHKCTAERYENEDEPESLEFGFVCKTCQIKWLISLSRVKRDSRYISFNQLFDNHICNLISGAFISQDSGSRKELGVALAQFGREQVLPPKSKRNRFEVLEME